jgi:short-subunit dehydrogenase
MTRLEGKLAVVTGASRGIGAALARALRQEGAEVLEVSRSGPLACDLADPADRARLIAHLVALGRPVDLFVNNAGLQHALDFTGACADLPERAEAEIALNLAARWR